MSLIFPSNPTLNQTYTASGNTWFWDGVAWTVQPTDSPSFNNITVANTVQSNNFYGTFFGPVVGNVTGNLLGNTSGTHTGNVSATTIVANTITGTISTTAQPNIRSLGTLDSLTVQGSVTASSLAAIITTPAQPYITSLGTLSGLTMGGNITGTHTSTATLATAAQPNITSVGTLTSVSTSGAIRVNGQTIVDSSGNVYAGSIKLKSLSIAMAAALS
jgi:hypothetical protein